MVGVLRPFSLYGDFLRLLSRERMLIKEMTRRALMDQYAGEVLGKVWAVAHPLVYAAIYIFIFAFVFKARFSGVVDTNLDYPAYILAGLVPWLGLIRSMNMTSSSLIGNANLVKQVVLPIEVLPIKDVLASFFTLVVSLVALILYVVATTGGLPTSYVLLPVLFIIQFVAMCGLGFLLAAITPFLKDIRELLVIFSQIGIFILPIVYQPQWIPAGLKPLLYANPFSYMIWCWQDVLFYGEIAHPEAWVIFPVFSLGLLLIGYYV
ncbi:MAG: ABC transporter permease, partial [Pseudomonadota bacterium]